MRLVIVVEEDGSGQLRFHDALFHDELYLFASTNNVSELLDAARTVQPDLLLLICSNTMMKRNGFYDRLWGEGRIETIPTVVLSEEEDRYTLEREMGTHKIVNVGLNCSLPSLLTIMEQMCAVSKDS